MKLVILFFNILSKILKADPEETVKTGIVNTPRANMDITDMLSYGHAIVAKYQSVLPGNP